MHLKYSIKVSASSGTSQKVRPHLDGSRGCHSRMGKRSKSSPEQAEGSHSNDGFWPWGEIFPTSVKVLDSPNLVKSLGYHV